MQQDSGGRDATGGRGPLDQAVEALVYAPVGLAVAAAEHLPELVDRGRQQLAPQIAMARVLGQLVVTRGSREARARLGHLGHVLGTLVPAPPSPTPPRPSAAGPGTAPRSAPDAPAPAAARASDGGEAGGLAIPGYDTLSAPQVVQRLAGLAADELESVRRYEEATRGRRTILSKIAHLQPPRS